MKKLSNAEAELKRFLWKKRVKLQKSSILDVWLSGKHQSDVIT